jgi:hypothetical protein
MTVSNECHTATSPNVDELVQYVARRVPIKKQFESHFPMFGVHCVCVCVCVCVFDLFVFGALRSWRCDESCERQQRQIKQRYIYQYSRISINKNKYSRNNNNTTTRYHIKINHTSADGVVEQEAVDDAALLVVLDVTDADHHRRRY